MNDSSSETTDYQYRRLLFFAMLGMVATFSCGMVAGAAAIAFVCHI